MLHLILFIHGNLTEIMQSSYEWDKEVHAVQRLEQITCQECIGGSNDFWLQVLFLSIETWSMTFLIPGAFFTKNRCGFDFKYVYFK